MYLLRALAARRWAAVGGGLLALGLLPAAVGALPAGDAGEVAAPELMTRIAASAGVAHEGYATATGSLGLPSVQPLDEVAELLSTTTRLRVWWEGQTSWRIDRLDLIGETGTYRSGDATTVWTSDDRRVVVRPRTPSLRLPEAADLEPGQLGRRLAAAAGDDPVTALPAERIAGLSVPGVRITPADPRSTLAHVDMWADADTGLPVRVEVTGRGAARPTFTSSYHEIESGRSGDARFEPAPDARTEVTEVRDVATYIDELVPYQLPAELAGLARRERTAAITTDGGVGTYGTGLAEIVVVPLPHDVGHEAFDGFAAGQQVALDRPGADARSVTTSLLGAVLLSHERRWYLLAGTVTVDALTQAARQLVDDPPPRTRE